jgi:hypothetical protein
LRDGKRVTLEESNLPLHEIGFKLLHHCPGFIFRDWRPTACPEKHQIEFRQNAEGLVCVEV